MSTGSSPNERQIKLLKVEVESFYDRLESMVKEHSAREKNLRDVRSAANERYSALLERYDDEIGLLHEQREVLYADQKRLEEEYVDIRDRLAVQRIQYQQLTDERAALIRQAMLEKVDDFRRNRAARIIQRKWRAHFERASSKKKKRKC